MFHFFQVFIYQPFFNLLVGLYWLLEQIPGFDSNMGVSVIVFTVIIRILLLPLSIAAHRGEKDRREIEKQIREVKEHYANDPVAQRQAKKKIFRRNTSVVVAEMVSLGIQIFVSLILWRIFASGLQGGDAHLVYSWMPQIFPIPDSQLTFMGYSLWEPHWQMNLFQSFLILILEAMSLYVSPYPVSKEEVIRLQLVLPVISFIIFSQLPAGKKLFVIVTLLFSILFTFVRVVVKKAQEISERLRQKEIDATNKEEKVVVEVK